MITELDPPQVVPPREFSLHVTLLELQLLLDGLRALRNTADTWNLMSVVDQNQTQNMIRELYAAYHTK